MEPVLDEIERSEMLLEDSSENLHRSIKIAASRSQSILEEFTRESLFERKGERNTELSHFKFLSIWQTSSRSVDVGIPSEKIAIAAVRTCSCRTVLQFSDMRDVISLSDGIVDTIVVFGITCIDSAAAMM